MSMLTDSVTNKKWSSNKKRRWLQTVRHVSSCCWSIWSTKKKEEKKGKNTPKMCMELREQTDSRSSPRHDGELEAHVPQLICSMSNRPHLFIFPLSKNLWKRSIWGHTTINKKDGDFFFDFGR